jgi:hypothetical protein
VFYHLQKFYFLLYCRRQLLGRGRRDVPANPVDDLVLELCTPYGSQVKIKTSTLVAVRISRHLPNVGAEEVNAYLRLLSSVQHIGCGELQRLKQVQFEQALLLLLICLGVVFCALQMLFVLPPDSLLFH